MTDNVPTSVPCPVKETRCMVTREINNMRSNKLNFCTNLQNIPTGSASSCFNFFQSLPLNQTFNFDLIIFPLCICILTYTHL